MVAPDVLKDGNLEDVGQRAALELSRSLPRTPDLRRELDGRNFGFTTRAWHEMRGGELCGVAKVLPSNALVVNARGQARGFAIRTDESRLSSRCVGIEFRGASRALCATRALHCDRH